MDGWHDRSPLLRTIIDSITLYYELRKRRLIGAAIVEDGKAYVVRDEWDPWGSKHRISWSDFELWVQAHLARAMVQAPQRKGARCAEENHFLEMEMAG